MEILGETKTHDLKEGGSEILVTDENKEEYIEYEDSLSHFLSIFNLHSFRILSILRSISLSVCSDCYLVCFSYF